jgi:hypothetical protein
MATACHLKWQRLAALVSIRLFGTVANIGASQYRNGAMKYLAVLLLLAGTMLAQAQWQRTEFNDSLHNVNGVRFRLDASEPGASIEVTCSGGKLLEAWLLTENSITDTNRIHYSDGFITAKVQPLVEIEYRRDDEPKAHKLRLPSSKDFHGAMLQKKPQSSNDMFLHGDDPRDVEMGLFVLLYPVKMHRKTGDGAWVKHIVLGVSSYNSSDAILNFDIPDPTPVIQECKSH